MSEEGEGVGVVTGLRSGGAAASPGSLAPCPPGDACARPAFPEAPREVLGGLRPGWEPAHVPLPCC